jgi:hypothetical protein
VSAFVCVSVGCDTAIMTGLLTEYCGGRCNLTELGQKPIVRQGG